MSKEKCDTHEDNTAILHTHDGMIKSLYKFLGVAFVVMMGFCSWMSLSTVEANKAVASLSESTKELQIRCYDITIKVSEHDKDIAVLKSKL